MNTAGSVTRKTMMTDTLYVKTVSLGGKTTYIPIPVVGQPPRTNIRIQPLEAGSIMSTVALSLLMSLSDQLPGHSKYARESKKLEQVIASYALATTGSPCRELVELGVAAWNEALKVIVPGLREFQVFWSAELQQRIDEARAARPEGAA